MFAESLLEQVQYFRRSAVLKCTEEPIQSEMSVKENLSELCAQVKTWNGVQEYPHKAHQESFVSVKS